MVTEITDQNFAETVSANQFVMIQFWAEWSSPCRMLKPLIEALSNKYDGKAVIGAVDIDVNSSIAMQYGIISVPTFLYFKDGQLVDKAVGTVPKSVIENKLKALVG